MKTIFCLFVMIFSSSTVWAAECVAYDADANCKEEAPTQTSTPAAAAPIRVVILKDICPKGYSAKSGEGEVVCSEPAPAPSKVKTIVTTAVVTAAIITILDRGGRRGNVRCDAWHRCY